ncbi:MAG: DUF998 domain-containing protein [Methanomassiliicoccus sp.]|nr:DUF998 domain-containing protein [Methanomassiliicoccus sp.]
MPDVKSMARHQWIGLIFFLAALQFTLFLMIAETQYPGYNAGANVISDLGVWGHASAIIFNSSIILFGALILAGTWLMHREWGLRLITLLFILAGIGAMGVGIFNEGIVPFHAIFALTAFLFGNLAVVVVGRNLRAPISYLSFTLGGIGLLCLVLGIGFRIDLGLGMGGMERMLVYPILLWMLGFGGALMAARDVIVTRR